MSHGVFGAIRRATVRVYASGPTPQTLLVPHGGSRALLRSPSWGSGAGPTASGSMGPEAGEKISRFAPGRCLCVTPHVSKPHDYVNHMFMRL
jgi:hypothetical protein